MASVAGMRLAFFHGAGGYHEDRPLAAAVAAALGAALDYPRLPDHDMSVAGWTTPIIAGLRSLSAGDRVVAHSFGASMMLQALSRPVPAPSGAVLLAMPSWAPDAWDVADYAFTGPEPATRLRLHHCRDDDVVPFGHLALNAALLPSAALIEHDVGGHQFDGLAQAIAASTDSASGVPRPPR